MSAHEPGTELPALEPPATAAEPSPPVPEPSPRSGRRGQLIGSFLIALLVSIVVMAPLAWQWWLTRSDIAGLQQQVAQKLADIESALKDARALAAREQEVGRAAQVKIGVLENKLAEFRDQQEALHALYQELATRSREDWALNEVEQLLVMANQQLELAGNVKVALTALESAEQRLAGIERPGFIALRKTIDADIERLRALPEADIAGLSVRLDNMIEAIESLPLEPQIAAHRSPEPQAAESRDTWSQLAREIWAELKSLIRITRVGATEPPLIAPDQAFFLRQNLRLRLLSARLNLLARNQAGFSADLKAAEQWLKQYYDAEAKAVQSLLDGIGALQRKDITISLPSIAVSLEAARRLKDAHEAGR